MKENTEGTEEKERQENYYDGAKMELMHSFKSIILDYMESGYNV